MTSSHLPTALRLAAIGMHVFPCYAKTTQVLGTALTHYPKTPVTRRGFTEATTDPKQIRAWFEGTDYLVGVAAGRSGVVVLDVDVDMDKGTDGWDSLADVEVADTFHYQTKRGGSHYVYAAPEGVALAPTQNHVTDDGLVLDGVDRRAGGSYFIWWADEVPSSRDVFTPAPEWFLGASGRVEGEGFSAGLAEWFLRVPQGEADNTMQRAIDAIPRGDFGHLELLSQQTYLVKLASEGHPGVEDALRVLFQEWTRAPYNDEDHAREFHVALQGAVLKYGKVPDDSAADTPKPRGLNLLRLSDLMSRPDPEWWVEGLIQQDTVALFAGEPGIGKTFVMLDVAGCIATGADWHGRKTKQGRVLYVVAEGAGSFGQRLMAWQDYNGQSIGNDSMGFLEQGINLSEGQSMKNLEELLEVEPFDLIVLDTFSQLSNVESENDAAQVSSVLRMARKIREWRPGSTVVIVHHTNKSERGQVRGSTVFRGNCDTVIVARPEGGEDSGSFYLSTEAAKDGKQKDGKAETLHGFAVHEHKPSAVIVQDGASKPDPDYDAIVLTLSDGQWHGIADFAAHMATATDSDKKRIKRRLDTMRTGFHAVEEQGNTKSKAWRFTEVALQQSASILPMVTPRGVAA